MENDDVGKSGQQSKPAPTSGNVLPSINAPKGGGAIKSIDEKLGVNAVTGTASTSIAIPTSAPRSGCSGPELSLSYDSGAGNGPFGFGWHVGLPEITRKTDKGLPKYQDAEESDTFILSGTEDLVPLIESNDGVEWSRPSTFRQWGARNFKVVQYRPRLEGGFSQIERWVDLQTQQSHWRTLSGSNVTTYYGLNENARVYDPKDPTKIFQWLISQKFNDRGHAMKYIYKEENEENVPLNDLNEDSVDECVRKTQRYPKRILYGNMESSLVQPDLDAQEWMFEVVFDYGEHDHRTPSTQEAMAWSTRPDPFSNRRSGFEIRTYRLCRRMLMIHHFPDEENVGRDCVVSALNITYNEVPSLGAIMPHEQLLLASCIFSVHQRHYVRQGSGYKSAPMPPLEYDYTAVKTAHEICDLPQSTLDILPSGLDGNSYFFLDLDGEGIPGILSHHGKSMYYSANLGNGRFERPKALPFMPRAFNDSTTAQQFMDLAGDGRTDLVQMSGPMPGFCKRDPTSAYDWSNFKTFDFFPSIDFADPNLRFIDLTGDGHADILLMDDRLFSWYESWGEEGFGPAMTTFPPFDEKEGPRVLASDGVETIHFADMTGDGLSDIARIRNGEICYWPNLGYGHFGPKVSMKHAPWFDLPERFRQDRLHLADIDGTGTTDILYAGADGVQYYLNQSGNAWTSAIVVPCFPHIDDATTIQVVDLFGTGTGTLLWSSSSPGHQQRQIRYIELVGPVKPYLISATRNNLGAETRIKYSSSTKFYLQDKQAGSPWATRLPFPVQVVEGTENSDQISGNTFYSRYAYHHGFYDGTEREFRGFGMVEQWDAEDIGVVHGSTGPPKGTNHDIASDLPPVLTKTWYHTGAYFEQSELQLRYECEYWREPGSAEREGWRVLSNQYHTSLSIRVGGRDLPYTPSTIEAYETSRALKGAVLHSEVYGLDGTDESSRPYQVTHSSYAVELLQPHHNRQHAVLLTHQQQSITSNYERQLYNIKGHWRADPRVTHIMNLETDEFGNVLQGASIAYGRRYASHDPLLSDQDREKQTWTKVTFNTSLYTNGVLGEDERRLPLPSCTKSFELSHVEPMTPVHGRKSKIFALDHIKGAIAAASTGQRDLPYEDIDGVSATEKGPYRRLLSESRSLYQKDNLDGPLDLGCLESRALLFKTFTLAFTHKQLDQIFVGSGKITADDLYRTMKEDGGYAQIDGRWWTQGGRSFYSQDPNADASIEFEAARKNFFLAKRSEDPFSTTSLVEYDRYNLLVKETRDAYDNHITAGQREDPVNNVQALAGFDYRVLSPYMVQDANGSRTMHAFDIHGMAVGMAGLGQPHERLGDTLDGFQPDLTEAQLEEYFSNPLSHAKQLLSGATSRSVHDNFAYYRTRDSNQPSATVVSTLSRETHVSDLEPGKVSRVFTSLGYYDGLGRNIQAKGQAEPGPVTSLPDLRRARRKDQSCQYAEENPIICQERWITSGWSVYNNKGLQIRVYEPFFSRTHQYETDNKLGVSEIAFYDPLGRTIGTLSPDHTWSKVLHEPWRSETWDKNDLVLVSKPAEDPDIGDYFRRLPEQDYLPTWYERHRHDPDDANNRKAAEKAVQHANTPSVSFMDSLGRPFLTVDHHQQEGSATEQLSGGRLFFSRTLLDIEGKEHEIRDTQDRLVSRMDYGHAGGALHHMNMDNGERWSLTDVTGTTMRRWDDRGQSLRTVFDKLRRAVSVHLKLDDEDEIMTTRTVYGECGPSPPLPNTRGRVVRVYDQSGLSMTDQYDYQGHLTSTTRQVAMEFKRLFDVTEDVELEPENYINHVSYDALGRQTSSTLPNGTRTRFTYNLSGSIDQVWSDNTNPETAIVKSIEYDAKGKQTRVEYGNGTTTKVKYDLVTFRLLSIKTTKRRRRASNRPSSSSPARPSERTISDITYTYDAIGNLVHSCDQAQEVLHFRGQVIRPDQYFTYDSLYRLVQAEGREHLGQRGPSGSGENPTDSSQTRGDHANDGSAMTRYTERYTYDSTGNLLKMQHESEGWHSWTRQYRYNEQSALGGSQTNNRLSETQTGRSTGTYRYDGLPGKHGNMTSLPSIAKLSWNHKDQLKSTCRQSSGEEDSRETTWYVYDDAGKRVRKITETPRTDSSKPRRSKETLYIGSSYEVFRTYKGPDADRQVNLELETLAVASGGDRLAMIENKLQGGNTKIPNQLIRYQYANIQKSVAMELDQDGNLITYEEYAPYGNTSYKTMHTQTEVPKRYRWTGKEKDTETGLYHNGLRYYMPGIGRWTSADPQGLVDGPNLYEYAKANPIAFTDPTGAAGKKVGGPPGGERNPLPPPEVGMMTPYNIGGATGKLKGALGDDIKLCHALGCQQFSIIINNNTDTTDMTSKLARTITSGNKDFGVGGATPSKIKYPSVVYPGGMEKLYTDHFEGANTAALEAGEFDDIHQLLKANKSGMKAAAEMYNALPGTTTPVEFNEKAFDAASQHVVESMEKQGIPTKNLGSSNQIPIELMTAEQKLGHQEAFPLVNKAAEPFPLVTPAQKPFPLVTKKAPGPPGGGIFQNAKSTIGKGLTSMGKRASGSSAAIGRAAAGMVAPFYSEFEEIVTNPGIVPALVTLKAGSTLIGAAEAAAVAPLTAYVTVAAPAVVGYGYGAYFGNAAREAGASDTTARLAGAAAGAYAGAMVGAAIGLALGGVSTPVAAAIGGVVGGIGGLLGAW